MTGSKNGKIRNVFLECLAHAIDKSHLTISDKTLFRTYVREAAFFWKFLLPLIESSQPKRVLEIGAGVGILSLLASTEVQSVTALEPESSGFGKMGSFRKLTLGLWSSESLPSYHKAFLDDLPEGDAFDFVFCINVLEHVARPDQLIEEVYRRLEPGGFAWFVCPNYSFPYEQHFEIPIVFSKSVTQRIFRKRIAHHPGMVEPNQFWQELSWPTQQFIRDSLLAAELNFDFKAEVLTGYFDRLKDEAFLGRKGRWFRLLGPLIMLSKPIILRLPAQFLPIIEFVISKPVAGQQP